ncbi:hypothetical protein I7I53_06368 [Histoplasma capsulatum var. duboisii H88]|uniref:Uncharacterized protein n=1 Tax=Ajellomyces capsulatus (strain H88) TaxID=544711 RepID=A0A8A1L9N6_AJEC8|nr:hypothetical protein I7I53_06368 [Histoplasma capsulatum var. duboisii H88]
MSPDPAVLSSRPLPSPTSPGSVTCGPARL